MRVRRSLAALCAVVPLAAAAAGCSDSSGGTISASNGTKSSQQIINPEQGKCHVFKADGMNAVANETGVDIRLHVSPDCHDPKGQPSFYLPATLSATSVPGQPLWRSFTTVGWLPPVPVA
jgi:hypothetical protein